MTAVPKRKPIRDSAHLDKIRAMPCCICNAPPPSEACHLRMGLAGGMAQKPPDDLTVPMCSYHHREQHEMGEAIFWRMWLAADKEILVKVLRSFARSLYGGGT